MHIPDGILPPLAWAGAYAVTGALTAVSIRKINQADDPRAIVPRAAMMTAAFFVASSIFFPMPPPMTSAHFILSGMMGVMLGWYAFPAILIGLILQAIVFGHGGITTLGANALVMGVPALLVYGLFSFLRSRLTGKRSLWFSGFLGGFLGVLIAAVIFYAFVIGTLPAEINQEAEVNATLILILSHLPVAIVEGLFTGFLVTYLHRTRPDLIGMQQQPVT